MSWPKKSPYPKDKVEPHLAHVDSLEVAWYGDERKPTSVTVECVKCGAVVAELIKPAKRLRPYASTKAARAAALKALTMALEPIKASELDMLDRGDQLSAKVLSEVRDAIEDALDLTFFKAAKRKKVRK